jgi:hypothetical protein
MPHRPTGIVHFFVQFIKKSGAVWNIGPGMCEDVSADGDLFLRRTDR